MRIEHDDVIARPIATNSVVHHGIGMVLGHIGKAGIVECVACPIQQRNVHHGVDNDPAGTIAVPRAYELTARIIATGQEMRRMKAACLAALVARQAIVGDSGKQPHEAHVMMESGVAIEGSVEFVLDLAGRLQELLILRSAITLP